MYEGKKRGRKSREEKAIWIEAQKLKITYGTFILNFD